jgi:hypothetical protein
MLMDVFANNLVFREKKRKKRLKGGILKEKRKQRRSGMPGNQWVASNLKAEISSLQFEINL